MQLHEEGNFTCVATSVYGTDVKQFSVVLSGYVFHHPQGRRGVLKGSLGIGVPHRPSNPGPVLKQKLLISLPYLTQEILFYYFPFRIK